MKKRIFLFFTMMIFGSNIFGASDPHPRLYEGMKEYSHLKVLDLGIVAKFLPNDPVIFEAGGHYGNHTVLFAKKWPSSYIITFEPNPNAYVQLLNLTEGYDQIHPYHLAVNNYTGTATLHVCYGSKGDEPAFEGASSLLEPTKDMEINYQGPKIEVPCYRLDDWVKQEGIDHIDFMWLDLEGLELQVLSSSPKILKNVKVIYTETNHFVFRKNVTLYKDLKSFLIKNGFALVAHCYNKGIQGDAIFVRKELLE